jgi:hypothetical protein
VPILVFTRCDQRPSIRRSTPLLNEDVTLNVLLGAGYTVAARADATASLYIANDDLVVIEDSRSSGSPAFRLRFS